jgi:uncharacterized integral membrane protein
VGDPLAMQSDVRSFGSPPDQPAKDVDVTQKPGPAGSARSGFRLRPSYVVALLIVVLVGIFVAQNRDVVDVELFTIDVTAPLWITLVAVAALGVIVGLLLGRRR